jgi:hypothetical protein
VVADHGVAGEKTDYSLYRECGKKALPPGDPATEEQENDDAGEDGKNQGSNFHSRFMG